MGDGIFCVVALGFQFVITLEYNVVIGFYARIFWGITLLGSY